MGIARMAKLAARDLARRLTRDAQDGFTIVEVVVAMLVLTAASTATFVVFTSSKSTSLTAQRHEVAIAQAQKALESLRTLSYEQVGLTKAPAIANRLESDPNRLGYYASATTTDASSFTVRSGSPGVTERLVLPDSDSDGAVDPDPTSFSVGGAGISGKVYRYVAWRPESCGADGHGKPLCPGNRQTKRLIVAVSLDPNRRAALTKPVWIATVVVDPAAEPYE